MLWWRRRKERERDLERELRADLELEVVERQAGGLPIEEARRAAWREFGNTTLAKEEIRGTWGWSSLEILWRDVRYACRGFRNEPQLTWMVLLTLALGIGANTGLFSVLNAVLLQTLPVARPEELLRVLPLDKRGEDMGFSWPLFISLLAGQRVFSGIYAAGYADPLDLGTTENEKAVVQMVSDGYFDVLDVAFSLGRPITREDNVRGAQPVAVISDRFWESHFHRNPLVLGRSITVSHQPVSVVGVAAPEFFGDTVGSAPDIWTPVILQPKLYGGHDRLDTAGVTFLHVVGRLRPGMRESQAQAGLEVSLQQIRSETDSKNGGLFRDVSRLAVEPASRGLSELRERFSKPLRFLMGLVALVLLLACANVANLLLARSAARQREVAVRLATGASRGRILRQRVIESLLLAAFGGLAGLWAGYALSHVLVNMVASAGDRVVLNVNPDLRVLGFTFLGALATGLLFGIGPALAAMRIDPMQALKAGAPRQKQKLSAGRMLVAAQVALSLLLVTAAGLFVHTLYNLRTFDAGFARGGVVQVSLDPAAAGYENGQAVLFNRRAVERLNRLPGVRASSFSALDPISGGGGRICCLALPGQVVNGNDNQRVLFNTVMPGYFEAVGMTILAGRPFDDRDIRATAETVVLNETQAKKLFGNGDAVGKYLELGWGAKLNRLQVIGVVKDARYFHLRERVSGVAYFPVTTDGGGMGTLYVRTAGDTRTLIPAVMKELKALDSSMPVKRVETIGEIVDRDLLQETLIAKLASGFGVLALLLAAVGLYGVLAYTVTRRTAEIGIRAALGAQRRDIIAMVAADASRLVGVGLAVGLPAAWAVAHLVSSMLFGFSPNDPLTFVAGIGALVGATVLASYIPVRRALHVDPLVALRYE